MAIVFVLSVAVVALSRPKGCGKLALPANTVVIWSAPFLSGGGYCSEVLYVMNIWSMFMWSYQAGTYVHILRQATTILRGLHECGIEIGAEQHGDAFQNEYINGKCTN